MLSDAFLSRFGPRPLAFVRDGFDGNDHEGVREGLHRILRLRKMGPTNGETEKIDMG